MYVSGMSFTAITKELGVSGKTIATYRARILEKMGLDTDGWHAYLREKRARPEVV